MNPSPIATRIARLRQLAQEKDVDTILIILSENRRYLSGFTGEETQFDEMAGALFITAKDLVLATDSRYELQSLAEAPQYQVFVYRQSLTEEIVKLLGDMGTRRLGFEGKRLSHWMFREFESRFAAEQRTIEMVDLTTSLESFRMIKDLAEIDAMRRSLAVAETAFAEFLGCFTPENTEIQAAWELEQCLRAAGAEGLAFPTIVAYGANSALPHAVPGDRRPGRGQPLLFDWGARCNGYCSDISRTLVWGQTDPMFEKVYETVYAAQQKAIAAIKPGVAIRTIDALARDHIAQAGFEGRFGHGLGHGVGLGVHEAPRIGPRQEQVLEPGMVFTVEPGIYIPDWGGIRLENMVWVTLDGVEVLNRLPVRLPIIQV